MCFSGNKLGFRVEDTENTQPYKKIYERESFHLQFQVEKVLNSETVIKKGFKQQFKSLSKAV